MFILQMDVCCHILSISLCVGKVFLRKHLCRQANNYFICALCGYEFSCSKAKPPASGELYDVITECRVV